jgi:hypothetical protein
MRERWQWFCTLTFNTEHRLSTGGMLPEKADKAFRWFLLQINVGLYGRRFDRKPHGGLIWARGTEMHKSGRPHFHAVVAAPDQDLNQACQRYAWHELWYREFGRNQIEQPRSQEEVAGYVSKYVAKEGEIDLSHNFGRVKPPALPWPLDYRNAGSGALKPALGMTRGGRSRGASIRPAKAERLSLTHPPRLQFPQYHSLERGHDEDQERDE